MSLNEIRPALATPADLSGLENEKEALTESQKIASRARPRGELVAQDADGREWRFVGRVAWALCHLIAAGSRGCTPIEQPGPRWSHYIFRLRREGIDVETIDETHGGPFPGRHARYVLRTALRIVGEVAT